MEATPEPPALSVDERALFNPAYVGLVIAAASGAHLAEHGTGMPVPLAWLIVPWAVPRAARIERPGNVRPYLATWLEEHSLQRIRLQQLAPAYSPVTRRALQFGLRHDLLRLAPETSLVPGPVASRRGELSADVKESLDVAAFLGRWLPRTGSLATVFALVGIRP